jgi:hypothetical protein
MNDEHDNAIIDREFLQEQGGDLLSTSMLREWWAEKSDDLSSRCHITRPPRIPQDADGHANLYYYDARRMLAFHWRGDVTRPIEVSYGGDHEAASWIFRFQDHRPRRVIAGTQTLVQAFEKTCKNWIDSIEEQEGLR